MAMSFLSEGIDADYIIGELVRRGFEVRKDSFSELPSKGVAGKVYMAESDRGKIIIHIKGFFEEQFIQKVNEKIYEVSKVLEKYPDIPTARVFLAGTLPNGKLYTVQEYIEGKPLGERIFKESDEGQDIADIIFPGYELLARDAQRFLGKFHEIKISGYGFLTVKDGFLRGEYEDWMGFLRSGSEIWCDNVYRAVEKNQRIKGKLKQFFEKYQNHLQYANGRFLTGDITNPGNILVRDGRIVALIDFEWAASGDPAWEFAFVDKEDIRHYYEYFEQQGKPLDREEFELRRKLYRVPWLLWATNVWLGKSFEEYLRNAFEKDLEILVN